MLLFTRCNKSQVSPKCVSSKYSTDHLYNLENAYYFEWKKKRTVFVHVSLNANEILLPAPFSRIGLCFYSLSQILCQKHLFGFDYHVFCTEIMNIKAILV